MLNSAHWSGDKRGMGKMVLLVALLVSASGCHRYGRASAETCHAKYVRDAWRPSQAKYNHCMDGARAFEEGGGEAGERERKRSSSGGFWTGAAVGAAVAVIATRNAYNRPVRCFRDTDGSVYCY